ncbi:MAG: hypothetical protein AABX70_02600 [Nanoarchaeota archaeon]
MKLKLSLFIVAILALGMVSGYYEGYVPPKVQGKPGSGLLYSNGRVSLYQNPQAFTGSGVSQARVGQSTSYAYNPFPMSNTVASGRKGGYSSYIYLDNQLAYDFYSNPNLLKPRYMTNNQRYLGAYPYTHGFYGPASQRDKRVPLLDVSRGEADQYRNQMGYLTRTSQYQRQY